MNSTAEPRYRLISADSHVNEPPDVWVSRIPARFKDRAPKMVSLELGDAWIVEGAAAPIHFGWNAVAGLAPPERREWTRFEEIRAGGYDPVARLVEMAEDGVDAEVLYPTPRLSTAIFCNTDVDFHHACVSAYNDWISEYAGHDPRRFSGVAMLPNRGIDGALAEIDRIADRPGIDSFVMACYPNGTLDVSPDDDAVWRALAERRLPIAIHVAMTQTMPGAPSRHPLLGRHLDAPNRIIQMVFSGIFDRVPELQVVIAEADMGWVPYVKEQIDNNFLRLRETANYVIDDLPSEYVARHFSFTYITDPFGLANAHRVGIDRIMWSSDYPHISTDWPNSWRTILNSTTMLDETERELVLVGNARRLYRFSAAWKS
jgi:predicted TIM-barrel fold metal-dependent hydrolase